MLDSCLSDVPVPCIIYLLPTPFHIWLGVCCNIIRQYTAYVLNPTLYKAGIASLADLNASSAVESGLRSLLKLQLM